MSTTQGFRERAGIVSFNTHKEHAITFTNLNNHPTWVNIIYVYDGRQTSIEVKPVLNLANQKRM